MDCPKCESKTVVLDTRDHQWRRRECRNPACGHKFYTVETIVERPPGMNLRGRPRSKPKAPPRKAPPPVQVAKPAERKPLPAIGFDVRGSLVDRPQEATPKKQTAGPAFSFALTMPPGAAVRLNR